MFEDMTTFSSKINKSSENFKNNYSKMQEILLDYKNEMKKSLYQGEEKILKKIKDNNRLSARERIELILDQDSPFLELLPLAGWGMDSYRLGGSVIGGIGLINNKLSMIIAHIGTVKGGAIDSITLKKLHRLNEIASENNLITVNLIESSGANLTKQSEIFNYAGQIFKQISQRSKNGIPTISIIFGNSAAGGAYISAVSDYIIMVKDSSKLFLAGPALVKMATGEIVDEESLGGANLHNRVSGVSDYLAEDENDALRIAREIVFYLKESKDHNIDQDVEEPIYNCEEILGIINPDFKIPFDIREIIARIVDGSRFSEFKSEWGITLVTGFATIHGYKVGIIANNGVLFSDSANKASHFIQLCNHNKLPIIFLQNITGFIVGKKYEEEGIIKYGAKMLNTVANSEVPIITIVVGASFGAGNFAMSGKSLSPRFIFSYPSSKMALMGPEQLTGVLELISSDKGNPDLKAKLLDETNKQSSAFFNTGQLWDDGIIDPRETRNYLAICLAVVNSGIEKSNNSYGVFRM
jgi:acetyl-CoA carboxylase carboxyltransferase component